MADEDSETPYTTTRAIEFMEQAKDESWCLHLSYIKPHWPYIVPAPYHDMYGPEDIIPVNRSHLERQDPHPLMLPITIIAMAARSAAMMYAGR